MELLRELADENAYARHLRCTDARTRGEEWRRFSEAAAPREIRTREVLLRKAPAPNGGLGTVRVGVRELENRTYILGQFYLDIKVFYVTFVV